MIFRSRKIKCHLYRSDTLIQKFQIAVALYTSTVMISLSSYQTVHQIRCSYIAMVTNTTGDQTTVSGDVIIYDLVTGDEIGKFNTVSSTTQITSTPSYNATINPTGSWVYVKVVSTGTASANAEVKLYGIRIVYV